MSSPVPVLGRDARLIKSSVAIGYGKSIKVSADAEEIKVYSMDSLQLLSLLLGSSLLSGPAIAFSPIKPIWRC
jgi:hypothetical protein